MNKIDTDLIPDIGNNDQIPDKSGHGLITNLETDIRLDVVTNIIMDLVTDQTNRAIYLITTLDLISELEIKLS